MGSPVIRRQHDGLAYYQLATLSAEPGVRHGCFTRLGGVSRPPFATLNVGASVGDDPAAVAANRQRCLAVLGLEGASVVSPCQVHGATVARVGRAQAGQVVPATDGLVTGEPGVALLLRYADCVPILLYDRERQAVGLLHAGWRGTLGGIAARGVAAMQEHFGSPPGRLWAGIGPAIGPCCYQVSADLAEAFAGRFGSQVVQERPDGAYLDLVAANVLALAEAGARRLERADLCTACHPEEFFSHRRHGGQTGRLAVIVGLVAGVGDGDGWELGTGPAG